MRDGGILVRQSGAKVNKTNGLLKIIFHMTMLMCFNSATWFSVAILNLSLSSKLAKRFTVHILTFTMN